MLTMQFHTTRTDTLTQQELLELVHVSTNRALIYRLSQTPAQQKDKNKINKDVLVDQVED